jgi:hypothetical protein
MGWMNALFLALAALAPAERKKPAAGQVTLRFTLPRHSVSLIQLNW